MKNMEQTMSARAPLQRTPHVLLAEDDTRMRQLVAATLRRDGFDVTEAKDGAELLDWIGELCLHPRNGRPVDLIITDIRMPTLSGLNVLTELRWDDCAIPVIMITAFGDEETHAEARRLGAAAVLDKPFELDDIRAAALHFVGLGEP
jgi:DNA-binding response OmpR family regulator